MTPEQLQQLNTVQKDLASLERDFYANNFSAQQDFVKKCSFLTRLKVPHYASDPAVGEVGEIIEVGGKLKICSSANTWTIVGTQS
jgi:hypothetical protein